MNVECECGIHFAINAVFIVEFMLFLIEYILHTHLNKYTHVSLCVSPSLSLHECVCVFWHLTRLEILLFIFAFGVYGELILKGHKLIFSRFKCLARTHTH